MTASTPVRRRDVRFQFNTAHATVEFLDADKDTVRAALLDLSAAGLAFETQDGTHGLCAGAVLRKATVRVGGCDLRGVLAIKGVRTAPTGRTRCGCLFYPESQEAELALMALLTGLEASGGASPDRPPVGRS